MIIYERTRRIVDTNLPFRYPIFFGCKKGVIVKERERESKKDGRERDVHTHEHMYPHTYTNYLLKD